MSNDVDKKLKEIQAESAIAADAAANLQNVMDALKKAKDSAAKTQKELSTEDDE